MGKRGEGWVALQIVLFAVILLAPGVSFAAPAWLRALGLALVAVGGALGTAGVLALGRSNLSVFPRPVEGGNLVTSGPYAFVRHPIYAGLILATLGWSLFRANLLGLALATLLFIFFDLKSRREERWLVEAHPGYPAYQQRVRKLIPFVY
jgi:protein-S-isoprenylcysteine O-methyltransferase Ste14